MDDSRTRDDVDRRVSARRRRRWILQGALTGALVAAVTFAAVERIAGDPEPVETVYAGATPIEFDEHQLMLLQVWDVRQPSSLPGIAGLGGDRYVSLTGALHLGEDAADDWIDVGELEVTLYGVDESGSEREQLKPNAKSRRKLENLSGVLRDGEPFWLRLAYEPPKSPVRSYELVLELEGEEYAFEALEEER